MTNAAYLLDALSHSFQSSVLFATKCYGLEHGERYLLNTSLISMSTALTFVLFVSFYSVPSPSIYTCTCLTFMSPFCVFLICIAICFTLSSVFSLGGKVLWCPHVKKRCAETSSKMRAMTTRRQLELPACRSRTHTHFGQRPDWFLFWNSIRWQAHEVGGTFCKPLLQDYSHKRKNRFGDVHSVWNGHVFQNRSLQFRTEPWDWIWLFRSSLSNSRWGVTGK